MSSEKVIINFKRHAYLLDLEKAMKKKTVIRLERSLEGLFHGEPYHRHTLTFHDPTEVQEKLVKKVKDLENKLAKSEVKMNTLSSKLQQAVEDKKWMGQLLKDRDEEINKIREESDKSTWKTFKDCILGRDQ